MRKRKFLALAVCAILCAGAFCAFPVSAARAATESSGIVSDPAAELAAFVTACPKREAGTEGERAAAEYLAARYLEMDYAPYEAGEYIRPFSLRGVDSRNVIAFKPAAEGGENAPLVVLGAHMDNAAKDMPEGYQGAYDNGTGVATLLAVAQTLREDRLPFDVIFVHYGAEELGLYGSQVFLENLLEKGKEPLFAVNFDVVGGGKNLYLYTDEVASSYDAYIRRIASAAGAKLADNPANKKIIVSGIGKFPYSHVGMMSDNSVYLARDIPVAAFFSYDWESSDLGLTEGAGDKIMHTPADDLGHLREGFAEQMSDAARTVTALLRDEDFLAEMTKIRKKDYSALLSRGLSWGLTCGIFAIGVLFVLLKLFSLRKKPPEAPANGDPEQKIRVFEDFE